MINKYNNSTNWWVRNDLEYIDAQLHFAGVRCADLIEKHGTPTYIYSKQRVLDNINRIQAAMDLFGTSKQLFFAMKANRNPTLLCLIAEKTSCGIDACSPREVELAISCGFSPHRISVTSTAVSDSDWKIYKKYPDILFNCDSIAALRRIGENRYRSKVGLRFNPQVGVGYEDNSLLQYSGKRPTKFGIYADRIDEARSVALDHGIHIVGLHMHIGSGFTKNGLPSYEKALESIATIASTFESLEYVNIGGGLGIPLKFGDEPINLSDWARIVQNKLGHIGAAIFVEPGDHIAKDAGILLSQVVEIEEKGGTHFAFVDSGFNVHPEPAFYDLPCEPVPIKQASNPHSRKMIIAGNINEALDVFNKDFYIDISQNEYIAFLNAGAYGASMSSNHCLRSELKEIVI